MNVVGAVLAAGASRRLGTPKQLLRLPDGTSLVRRAAQTVRDSQAARCAVIVGENPAPIVDSLGDVDVDVVPSENPAEGIAASIRAAATWASAAQAEALLLCVCDQPALTAPHLNELLSAWREHEALVASYYAGTRGVPALFPARYFPELRALRGDTGAGTLLKVATNVVLVDWPEGEQDIDTPLDWQRARGG